MEANAAFNITLCLCIWFSEKKTQRTSVVWVGKIGIWRKTTVAIRISLKTRNVQQQYGTDYAYNLQWCSFQRNPEWTLKTGLVGVVVHLEELLCFGLDLSPIIVASLLAYHWKNSWSGCWWFFWLRLWVMIHICTHFNLDRYANALSSRIFTWWQVDCDEANNKSIVWGWSIPPIVIFWWFGAYFMGCQHPILSALAGHRAAPKQRAHRRALGRRTSVCRGRLQLWFPATWGIACWLCGIWSMAQFRMSYEL